MPGKENKPFSKEDIDKNPDPKISEDFPGTSHGPAKEDPDTKDGEKIIIDPKERESLDEQESDGSANAFDDK